jgi:hypothetical protein
VNVTSALAGDEWSASRPDCLTPGERASGIHWIGGWVDPRAGLGDVEKRKLFTLPGLEFQPLCRPARKPVAMPTELPRLLVRLLEVTCEITYSFYSHY